MPLRAAVHNDVVQEIFGGRRRGTAFTTQVSSTATSVAVPVIIWRSINW